MLRRKTFSTLMTGLSSIALLGSMLTACSQTAAPGPSIVQRAEGEKPAAPPPTGFLGTDYSLLKAGAPGAGQEAMLAYTNPSANFTSYTKIIIAPVTYWADDDSKLAPDQQQLLCNYFYSQLTETFGKNFTVVQDPGPGVAKLTVALTDASSATPVLRTISVVEPHVRLLSMIKKGLTGTYAFVGSATGEAKLTDSMTGQLLAAWADQRFGTIAVKNAGVWEWGDADHAMNYWSAALDKRLVTLGIQNIGVMPANN
jgi:hypothetical protein